MMTENILNETIVKTDSKTETKNLGPLAGVRVLDLSRILAGPFASQQLGDLGAEILKIERPSEGDDTRTWGPPFTFGEGEERQSAYFQSVNRNKKSLAINFRKQMGADLIRTLAKKSDIFIENYKVGTLKKYGLDYETIKQINPKIMYCSITGFGQTGPLSHKAGYDYMIQAMGGLMSITGQADGHAGAQPMKVGVAVADLFTGLYAVNAILAGLYHAEKSGQGQYIDLALMDCQIAMLANQGMNYLITGKPPSRLGNNHPNIVPYQVFITQDGLLVVAIGNDRQFKKLCTVLGQSSWYKDARFTTNQSRVKNRDALTAMLAPLFKNRSNNEWVKTLDEAGLPCGPIRNIDEVLEDDHCAARKMVVDVGAIDESSKRELASNQTQRLIGNPIKLSNTPIVYDKAPPQLGSSTQQILKDLADINEEEFAKLQQYDVV